MTLVPNFQLDAGCLIITLIRGTPVREVSFDCVLDSDNLGATVGVEILSFSRQLGVSPPPRPESSDLHWSYDDEMDAFYLRLQSSSASSQSKRTGRASFDDSGTILALEILV